MTIDQLREIPAFVAAWSGVRDGLLEFLVRRQLAMSAQGQQETGQQAISKLILDLEKLDAAPRSIVRPKTLKPLHSMSPNKPKE